MRRLLCPSMMCANYGHLAAEVRALDDAGVDIFHCDIMDGSFVPNFTMGVMDVQTIRRYTDKPVDCHLMIENPGSSPSPPPARCSISSRAGWRKRRPSSP